MPAKPARKKGVHKSRSSLVVTRVVVEQGDFERVLLALALLFFSFLAYRAWRRVRRGGKVTGESPERVRPLPKYSAISPQPFVLPGGQPVTLYGRRPDGS